MAETAERLDDEERERTIYLPQPKGHRRAALRYRNGLVQQIDMQPEELASVLDAFVADPSQGSQLHLRDATFGELYVVTRHAAEKEVLDVLVAWVENPTPQLGTRGGVVVAREMPEPRRDQERRRNVRRLN